MAGPYGALKLGVRIENHSLPAVAPQSRPDGLSHALIAAHALIWVPGGTFLSMTDPPQWAAEEVAALPEHRHVAGPRRPGRLP